MTSANKNKFTVFDIQDMFHIFIYIHMYIFLSLH